MKKTTRKIMVSALLGASIGVSAVAMASCGGSYELTDFSVDTSGLAQKVYVLNSTVTFEGLKLTAGYSDDSTETIAITDERVKVFLGEDDITANLSKLTESVGEKKVKFVFTTKYGEKSKEITVYVSTENITVADIASYSAPIFIANFNATVAKADNNAEATDFESKFFKTEDMAYSVGADNAFKFLPEAYDEDFNPLAEVVVNSTVQVMVDGSYQTLTKGAAEGDIYLYEYKLGQDVLVVEDAAKNEFDFTAAAIGKNFKVSVLPDEIYGAEAIAEFDAVEFEFEVVDGYNVYTAAELAVLDNSNRNEWKSLKAGLGLTDVTTNGVVLHGDMKVTTDHIPTEFTYTLEETYNIVYKKDTVTGAPEDFGLTRTFLWDNYSTSAENNGGAKDCSYVELFVRKIPDGGNFGFYGNYYSLDLSALPLVASFDSGKTASGNYVNHSSTWYNTDFSNATFLYVTGNVDTLADADENCVFKNLAVLGNAQTEALFVTDGTQGYKGNETQVYCGGIIFTKFHGLTLNLENVRTYKFFISLFGEPAVTMNFTHVKCYDSTSNAMFIWENADVNIQKSYFQRAGGPLMLIQHAGWDSQDPQATMARINISADSVMEAYVDGSEAWFQSIPGSGAILAQFRQLDPIFQNAGNVLAMGGVQGAIGKSMYRADGKMNIIALLMSDGTDPQAAMGALGVQGSVTYGTTKLDRITDSMPVGATVQGILTQTSGSAPTFNITDNVYYYGGEEFGVMTPTGTTANSGYGALAMELQTATHIAINYGGLGLLFGLSDYIVQS